MYLVMTHNFSVLMSIYHKEDSIFFNDALDSIYKQTYQPEEVIIVHDGQLTPDLYHVLNEWELLLPIKNIKLDHNCGLGVALNIGLDACSNDIIMRVDTDDINMPNRFEIQYTYLTQHPDITLCGSHVNEFDTSSTEIIRIKKVPIGDDIFHVIKKRNPFNHMSVCFRKTHITLVGGYMDLPYMEDYYLWVRLLDNGYKLVNLDAILVSARVGDAMVNRRKGLKYVKSEFRMLKYILHSNFDKKYQSVFFFSLRAISRVLPTFLLSKIYSKLRD